MREKVQPATPPVLPDADIRIPVPCRQAAPPTATAPRGASLRTASTSTPACQDRRQCGRSGRLPGTSRAACPPSQGNNLYPCFLRLSDVCLVNDPQVVGYALGTVSQQGAPVPVLFPHRHKRRRVYQSVEQGKLAMVLNAPPQCPPTVRSCRCAGDFCLRND